MHSDKKLSKEDTWRADDLRRQIREGGHGDGHVRRRDDSERKHRGGESTERRHRDPEKESRRERDKRRDRETTSKRRDEDIKDSYVEKRKEGSRDRRGDKERDRKEVRDKDTERRKERDRVAEGTRHKDDNGENRDGRRDREERHEREREKERNRDKERDRERRNGEDGDRRREERDKERRREEREHRERRRREEGGEAGRDREQRERHRERERQREEDKRSERERHGDRKRSEHREERDYREEHRRHKEERERRHKEREYDEQKQRRDTESREHRGVRKSGEEEEKHRHGDGERGDRDKHREKKHREDEDPGKRHRDRQHREDDGTERTHGDKTSVPEKSREPQISAEKTEETESTSQHWTPSVTEVGDPEEAQVVNEEDSAAQEYEDDFEDYEEDFEELDQSENEDEDGKEEDDSPEAGEEKEEVLAQSTKEIEAIRRAMNEENERVGTDQSAQSTRREEEEEEEEELKSHRGHENNQRGASQHGRFIDFVAAKRREVSKKVASKQKKRSTELLRLIDLDFSMPVSLLDLAPVNEYDMYIRTFGAANTKQAYAQCNEDNTDRDVQTEEIEACEKWTQHPPEHSAACGDPNLSEAARERNAGELNFDSQRLTAFLRSASQVMVVLLEEDRAEKKSLSKLRTQTDSLSFSDGSLQLNTKLPFLYGRHISLVHFSQVQKHTMMTVHAPTTKPSSVRLDSCTLICIWNIWEPSRPQKILVHESEVQCCCFSPGKATLVFAGTSVGSVALWDLREHATDHYHLKIGETEWTLRHPTFFTNAVTAAAGHSSSVSSIEVVPGAAAGALGPEVPPLASEEESSGLAFQLASLDESGILNFWVVVELPKANEAGSPTDLGLRPGGKVKLLHSSSLFTAESVSPRDGVKIGPLQTLHLKFLPSDSSRFLICTNMGLVRHGTSHGLKAPPKFYGSQEAGPRPVDVTAIHFSPFSQNLFLVGCSDGSIRLHTVGRELPVAEWRDGTAGEAVVSLQWTQTRPTVFCVLDSASNLHVWDLLRNDSEPVVTEKIPTDSVTAMAVFGDSGTQNTYSGVALVHESGKIEMQYFTRDFTVTVPAEEEKLETMVTEAL